MSQYVYPNSLDCTRIRLLRFEREGAGAAELEISLIEFPLSALPIYHALSYTWGPPREEDQNYDESDKIPIKVNGAKFEVLPNLYNALTQLRFYRAILSEYYWVDAICIDQNNIPERGIQVNIMDQIYKRAAQVDIWLGEADGNSVQVVGLVAGIGNLWKSVKEDIAAGRTITFLSKVGDNTALTSYGLPPWTNDIWIDSFKLFRRSWFRRVWIIQENALAKKTWVLLGKNVLDWSYFGQFPLSPIHWPSTESFRVCRMH